MNSREWEDTKSWSYEHFLGLVLLYASYADYDYSEAEKAHILTYLSPEGLEEVESLFLSLGDYEQLELILSLKNRFIKSPGDKETIFKVLKDHFNSDGDFSRLESGLYDFLRKLL